MTPRRRSARLALLIVVTAAVYGGAAPGAALAADTPAAVTVTAAPKWGPVPPTTWTPYVVTLRNDGPTDVDGEVVLVPHPEPAVAPVVRPPGAALAADAPPPPVLALGNRSVTAGPLRGEAANRVPPTWPTYRSAVTLSAGSEKTLTMMVVEAPSGHGVELHDRRGRVVARSATPPPSDGNVLVLSDVQDAEGTIEGTIAVPGALDVHPSSASDFPDTALGLAGLAAVVVADFDTATLSPPQRRALQDYVSLGGTLVVTGGAAWARSLGALPAGMAPLRASASTSVSLAPLADLGGATTALTADVATGEVIGGRVVLGAPDGPPLVLEADYGAGRVVQLTYDPLAEPLSSEPVLGGLAWDQALLGRIGPRWGQSGWPTVGTEDQLWLPAVDARPWPSWPGWAAGLLVVYAAVFGPAALVVSRRVGAQVTWAFVALTVLVVAAMAVGGAHKRSGTSSTTVVIRTAGADGTVLESTYRGLRQLSGSDTIATASSTAMASLFTAKPVLRPVNSRSDPQATPAGQPVARGPGGGSIVVGADGPRLRLSAKAWELRTIDTISITQGGPALDAELRLDTKSDANAARLIGTLTNRGSIAVSQVRGQTIDGQAHLVDELGPGESRPVDAPILKVRSEEGGQTLDPQPIEESLMFAAASRSFTGPDQVALVGLTTPAGTEAGGGKTSGRSRFEIAVTLVPLKASDAILTGSGGARLTSSRRGFDGDMVQILDMAVPPGLPSATISYVNPAGLASFGGPGGQAVYNWTTGTWRQLPAANRTNYYAASSLEPGEMKDGLVRLRVLDEFFPFPSPSLSTGSP